MNMINGMEQILQVLFKIFNKPSRDVFLRVLEGWILSPSRRYVTNIFRFGDSEGLFKHDSFHDFFRKNVWNTKSLLKTMASILISLVPVGVKVQILGDDTVHKKTGRKVEGAKSCRDAVRSTSARIAYVWGLQIVLVSLCYRAPWGGEPLALPLNLRLYRKRLNKDIEPSLVEIMREMLQELVEWFPNRFFHFTCDGFYASLIGNLPANVHMTSRMRGDAAIYTKPCQPKKRGRGAPRKKGTRLPTPLKMAQDAKESEWKEVETCERGKTKKRLVIYRRVIWYKVNSNRYVLLVISRDPEKIEADDYFVTSDFLMKPEMVISHFANRWSIEDTFRNVKQYLGIEEPQSWKNKGPERVAAVGYVVYSMVWFWFIKNGNHFNFPFRPWYVSKKRPSFQDALADLRRKLWENRINECMDLEPKVKKMIEPLIESLARVA